MGDPIRLVWFGDEYTQNEAHALFVGIYSRTQSRKHQLVNLFLDNALAVLREELAKMKGEARSPPLNFFDLIATINSIEDDSGGLLDSYRNFLMVVLNIALFIGSHEETETPYTDCVKSRILLAALSAGMLPAAAVAAASSLSDLVVTGPEAARVAFRIGSHIHQISGQLEPMVSSVSRRDSCVYAVTSLRPGEVESEINAFNSTTHNEGLTRLYISSSDQASTTVTGPPSRLQRAFRESERLRSSKWTALPVYGGLAHASHLYDEETVQQLLQDVGKTSAMSSRVVATVISSHTGLLFSARDGNELLRQVALTLLTKSVHTDRVQKGICNHVLESGQETIEFWSSQTSHASHSIVNAIEAMPNHRFVARDMTTWTRGAVEYRDRSSTQHSKLAVVGMSCRMPGGADSPELFWQLLMDGRDTCMEVPKDRFDLDTHYDATGETVNATKIRHGNFIDNPGNFDAAFFNMSPREADNTDPAARLALATAYEALEMAGYTPNRTPSSMTDRIGTYLGQASDDWRELNASQKINAFIVPGGVRAFAGGRINYFLKLGGPSINIDTACSSGLAAVNAACSALWAGEVDMAIAGGVNVITDPDNYCGLGAAGFLSPTGQCKVWDINADGYCRADGIGTIVLKRLEDAEADNDNILAVVLSAATNHSANAPSITHPELCPELHGTGTQAGDVVEAQSIEAVFAPAWPRRNPDRKLFLGAVKSNIGHGEAAAGIASLIKALLCYQHATIPKHIGIQTQLNPSIPADLLGLQGARLSSEHTAWPRPSNGASRLAVVNSFGAHGGNTTVLLQDVPSRDRVGIDPRTVFPIAVSAKSRRSLRGNLQKLLSHLDANPDVSLGDLSYTLMSRRIHHSLRVGTSSTTITDVKSWLSTSIARSDTAKPVASSAPDVVLVFGGQGSYYEGIARQLMNESAGFRTEVSRLNDIATSLGFAPVLLTADKDTPAPTTPCAAQLTLTIVQIALLRYLDGINISPSLIVGHSLGEYAALVASGVLSAADAIMLVGSRANLLQEHCVMDEHRLLAVRNAASSPSDVMMAQVLEDKCKGLEIACINDSKSLVVGGKADDIQSAKVRLKQMGYAFTSLETPYAFHTSQVEPILDAFAKLANTVPYHAPRVPYLSPLLKLPVFDAATITGDYLRRACRETVDFKGTIEIALEEKLVDANTIFIELGCHPVLLRSVQDLIPEARTFATLSRTEPNWKTITKTLVGLHCAGVSVRWKEYFAEYERAHRLCNLPAYAWNDKIHWLPYTGRWTLDKGSTDPVSKPIAQTTFRRDVTTRVSAPSNPGKSMEQDLRHTPLFHTVLADESDAQSVRVVILSDLASRDVQHISGGHCMNGHRVASSSVWCSMAFSISKSIFGRLTPDDKVEDLTILNLQVHHAQVLDNDPATSHWIRLEASMQYASRLVHIEWSLPADNDSLPGEPFASCTVMRSEKPTFALSSLRRLVMSRVDQLDEMVPRGFASIFSKTMTYSIFRNVVDYSSEYQGMDKVIMTGYEAYASIRLSESTDSAHELEVPSPCWIDSITHIAGLVMNGSELSNTRDFVWVTPGFAAFRLSRPLQAGVSYISYVNMAPTDDPKIYAGDVFIALNGEIIGMLEQIKFRQLPRILVKDIFSPDAHRAPKAEKHSTGPQYRPEVPLSPLPQTSAPRMNGSPRKPEQRDSRSQRPRKSDPAPVQSEETWPFSSVLQVLVDETGLRREKFTEDSEFADLGVDSLMSLVITTKLRQNLGIDIKHSIFLEHGTVGRMKQWLLDNF